MKEVKITPPEGYEIDKENSTFERIVFKSIQEKNKWEDFGPITGYYIDNDSIIRSVKKYATTCERNTWPSREEAEACLALSQLCQWRDKVNEEWKPSWNKNDPKYCISVSRKGFTIASGVLVFKSEEIRDKFLKDHSDLIQIAKPLL